MWFHMVNRPFWKDPIHRAWMAGELGNLEFSECDLPGDAARLADSEAFFRSVRKPRPCESWVSCRTACEYA